LKDTLTKPAPEHAPTAHSTKTQAADQAPLGLTDDQLGAIMRLATPLQPQCRDAFLRILAHELRDKRDVGDGELHRIAAEVIRGYRLFDPPISTTPVGRSRGDSGRMPRVSKWDR
jgi:hypothetical protein